MPIIKPETGDIKTASTILGVPPKTIRNRMSKGTWPLAKLPYSNRILFRLSDIYALVEESQPRQAGEAKKRGRRRLITKKVEGGGL